MPTSQADWGPSRIWPHPTLIFRNVMSRQSRNRKERLRVALIGEGQTEQIYFTGVKGNDRPDDIDLYPSLPRKKGTYANVLDEAIRLCGDYTVFALIDMDTIVNGGNSQEYYTAKKKATDMGIIVLENYPCFEIWFLLHFTFTGRPFTRCDDVVTELRQAG